MSAQNQSLSILIPNYNWPVFELIKTLHNLCQAAKVPFEILCFDDAQKNDFATTNLAVNKLENAAYKINPETLGRSQNRNALATAAKHEYLLFLDGDAKIENPHFISTYLAQAKAHVVVCGGTAYYQKPPENKAHLLRYLYGKNREERSAKQRQDEPWNGFSAFNFLLPAALFFTLKFDEKLTQYGHEDTLFGNELKRRNIPIVHIQNAALHLGLDDATIFLEKTRKSVENIRTMIDFGAINNDVKLYDWYARVRRFNSTKFLGFLFKKFHVRWEKNLAGPHPNLALFDFYKLAYLCSLPRHQQQKVK